MANVKTFANTFLYSKYNAEKDLFEFIMRGEVIDKKGEGFNDIDYEVKRRQISNSLIKVLHNENVILIINSKPNPLAFKVFVAKDVKASGKKKVFIDCTSLITNKDGYKLVDPDKLVAYLVSAMNNLIYDIEPGRIVNNSHLSTMGATCFSKLFTHVVDYIYKISTNSTLRDKCLYLTSMYYLTGILGKEFESDSSRAIAKKISGLSDREADIIKYQLESNSFLNIKYFTESLAKILRLDKLTVDLLVEKWMWLYGPGTAFGLELYTSFASMLTDTYVGCYINNQKTIEKITGRDMVDFTKTLLSIGGAAI